MVSFEYLCFISKVTILQLPQTLLHQWKDNSLISLKEVMDQSHVQLQVILHQRLHGLPVLAVTITVTGYWLVTQLYHLLVLVM